MILLATMAVAQATKATPLSSVITVKLEKSVPNLRPIAYAPSPSGALVAVCMEDGTVRILNAKTRATVRNLARHPQPAYAVAWSPDGAWVATGDESARVWIEDARNGSKVREYRTHTRGVQKVSFNRSRQFLASTGRDDAIMIYDTSDPKPKEKLKILGKGANVYGAEFDPTSTTILGTGILSDAGREYDVTVGKVAGFLSYSGSQGTYDIAYHPAGTRMVTAGRDATAVVWDTKNNKKLATLRGHGDWVVDAAFSPNGRLIATSSTDRTVKIWNVFNYKKVADIPEQSSVGSPLAWTADGNYLLTVDVMGGLQVNRVTPTQSVVTAKPVKKPAKSAARRRG